MCGCAVNVRRPIDETCDCVVCRDGKYSRAYLHTVRPAAPPAIAHLALCKALTLWCHLKQSSSAQQGA